MIVVTGGAGFIGSALIWRLNQRSIRDIIVVDECSNLNEEKNKNLKFLKYRNLIDKDDFLTKFTGNSYKSIEFIFHIGACSNTTEINKEYLMNTNYRYTKQLAATAVKESIPFIYASSGATYGDGSKGFDDTHDKLEQYTPLNMYGHSKHLFDLWAKKNGLLDKITALKYFNVYGPNEYHKGEMQSFVVKAFEQIRETGKVRLFKSYRKDYKNGEQKRDFIYIMDAVDMTLHFFDNVNIKGLYNIGSGLPRTWNDLAAAVFNTMGRDLNIEYIEMPQYIRGQYQYYTCAAMEKFKSSGFKFSTCSLEEGIEDYIRNYLILDKKHMGA